MPEFASEASQLTDGDAPRGLARRRFLTFLVAAPALTVAARVGAEVLTPAKADAVVPSPPQPADVADFGDLMTALSRADTDLFVLQVTAENRIRFEVPLVRTVYPQARESLADATPRDASISPGRRLRAMAAVAWCGSSEGRACTTSRSRATRRRRREVDQATRQLKRGSRL